MACKSRQVYRAEKIKVVVQKFKFERLLTPFRKWVVALGSWTLVAIGSERGRM